MRAARFDIETGGFGLKEVDVPKPGPGQVLIKVAAAGVCLSDVHIIDGSLSGFRTLSGQTEVTLGHEVAGTIEELGADVPDDLWRAGQRVVLTAGDSCGRCWNCRYHTGFCLLPVVRGVGYDGGWAEYLVTAHLSLVPLPDNVPFEQACIIPDAVSTPYAALLHRGELGVGQAVGLWGIGGLGVHAVQIARLAGAAPIIAIDPLPHARERALALGADLALDPADPTLAEQVGAITGGRGLDLAVDLIGHPAVRAAGDDLLAPHGKLVLVGMTEEPLHLPQAKRFNAAQHEVRGAYGGEPADLHTLVRLAATGRLDLSGSITETLPLDAAEEAVHKLENKIGNPIRIVLKP
ncbi:D-arabinose 1-dehydrogenase-like Zn-dependent alcohol dehydrogenase [Crossiella equi]|uniref:D-arabinose 1-dehydrogenase-like Zn-dependent alcohol dehydrogenase n=1 Tax=Crossiella equi TaxID=130796 RepID=A0ABS5A8Q0_9PSEU|nr:zinc-binding dehydrogenase [Crossiella equi]MBP2472951.1 D-arabinose 1-dehydrogenase-like Zn-dependent alcohol dehydrogenase [Crossiella equi]